MRFVCGFLLFLLIFPVLAQAEELTLVDYESLPAEEKRKIFPDVVVTPTYPMKAQDEHLNGRVLVTFSLSKEGTVEDIVLIEEEPEGYGFAKASIKAFKKFTYKPYLIDGEPQVVEGIRYQFLYELPDYN